MKNMLRLVLCIVVLFFSTNTFAQQSFGHINSIELLSSMSEWKSAQKELETFAEKLKQRLESQEKSLIEEYNKLLEQDQKGLLTPVAKEQKAQEIQQKQVTLEQDNMKAQNDVLQKETELTTPIRERVLKAIQDVAAEKGYTYIFDVTGGSILYADETQDISSFVKSKLGL